MYAFHFNYGAIFDRVSCMYLCDITELLLHFERNMHHDIYIVKYIYKLLPLQDASRGWISAVYEVFLRTLLRNPSYPRIMFLPFRHYRL